MNIVIIGGGKLGYSLAINMLDRDFRVNVIEKNKVRAMNLANELDAEVICGDGTELEVLMKAGVQEADCFACRVAPQAPGIVKYDLPGGIFSIPAAPRPAAPAHLRDWAAPSSLQYSY